MYSDILLQGSLIAPQNWRSPYCELALTLLEAPEHGCPLQPSTTAQHTAPVARGGIHTPMRNRSISQPCLHVCYRNITGVTAPLARATMLDIREHDSHEGTSASHGEPNCSAHFIYTCPASRTLYVIEPLSCRITSHHAPNCAARQPPHDMPAESHELVSMLAHTFIPPPGAALLTHVDKNSALACATSDTHRPAL